MTHHDDSINIDSMNINDINSNSNVEFYINGLIIDYYKKTKIFETQNLLTLKIVKQPNSVNRYCYCLNDIMKQYIKNIITGYYDNIREYFDENFTEFKTVIGFITINSPNIKNGVALHRDKSDYTFNMFLNDNYEGGTIIFCGKSDLINKNYRKISKKINDNFICNISPEKNKIIIHRGYNAHQVEPVRNGTRYNLILWCYKYSFNNNDIYNFNEFII